MRYLVTFVTFDFHHPTFADSSPKETGRTAHDAFLRGAGKVPDAGGEAVEVDGCCVGHLADMTLEQTITGVRIHLEIAPTSETMKKMGEYAKIMSVMADKNC